MNLLINFVLFSGVLFIIVRNLQTFIFRGHNNKYHTNFQVETTSLLNIETEILHLFSNGLSSATVTNQLKLLNGGKLAMTEKALVWKGITDVFILKS